MAKTIDAVVENGKKSLIFTGTHKLILAGLGAGMLVQDELGKLAEKLIERGETTETKGRERIDELRSARKKQGEQARKRFEDSLGNRMEDVLHRLNLPTQSEVKSLNTKITRLTKKVDELKKASA